MIAFEAGACAALIDRDVVRLNSLFFENRPSLPLFFTFRPDEIPFSFTWHVFEAGRAQIGFGATINQFERSAMIYRFLQIFPLLERVAKHAFDGQVVFNVSDEVGSRHIGFCSKEPDAVLIPDCEFISSFGYNLQRQYFQKVIPWELRSNIPYWRGSPTGIRHGRAIIDLPRAALCSKSKQYGYDCLMTTTYQCSEQDVQLLSKAGFLGPPESWQQLGLKRFNIDIDGNTSSWSGLFQKLLAGGVVLKVFSDYRQWFYHRLEPWVNFVPISKDLNDLPDIVHRLQEDDELARKIAYNGRRLALAMTYEQEMALGECEIIAEEKRQVC